jgi:hypothetical protein
MANNKNAGGREGQGDVRKPLRGVKPMTMREFERSSADKKADRDALNRINEQRRRGKPRGRT